MKDRATEILEIYQEQSFEAISNEYDFLRNFINENTEECSEPLYRGIVIDEETFTDTEVGQTVSFTNTFESFTEDFDIAMKFAHHTEIELDTDEWLIPFSFVYELYSGEGLPVYSYTENDNELEWLLLSEEYIIDNIEVAEGNPKLKIITIRKAAVSLAV